MIIRKGDKSVKKEWLPGAEYVIDYIDQNEQQRLIDEIKSRPWSLKLSRMTQHYGYEYNYRSRTLSKTIPIPEELKREGFDQLIVNHYKPGQSIAPHVDHTTLFDEEIHIISLCDNAYMLIGSIKLELSKGSLLILKGDARYKMKHSLKYDGNTERISLTYRKVVNPKMFVESPPKALLGVGEIVGE